MAKETKSTKEVEVSKEELDKKRKEVTAYYKEHIPSLKTQLQYGLF